MRSNFEEDIVLLRNFVDTLVFQNLKTISGISYANVEHEGSFNGKQKKWLCCYFLA